VNYIYFDCYSGFDLQMALGSLIDMTKDTDTARKACDAIITGGKLYTEETRRQSMEALLAFFDVSCDADIPDTKELIEKSHLSEKTKSLLTRWLIIKDDGKNHPCNYDLKETIYCAACLSILENIGAEKIYISSINQGTGVITKGTHIDFIPSKHTELLSKMANIPVFSVDIEKEILTPGALAFLYVLNAEHMPPKAHNVIKSGYGAGAENLSIPNLARCVLADDTGDETKLSLECIFSDMTTEFAMQ